MKRKIITIDEDLCDGCGACTTGCPEGALRVVDGKARLVGDLLCDGLGACLGTCPRGAISVEEREAVPYDERVVMESMIPKGEAMIRAHLDHLRSHGEDGFLKTAVAVLEERNLASAFGPAADLAPSPRAAAHEPPAGCPGLRSFAFRQGSAAPVPSGSGIAEGFLAGEAASRAATPARSELRQWPIQLHLINPRASQFQGAALLLAADCVAFSVGDFHERFLKGRALAIACPKLDEGLDRYTEKLTVLIDEAKVDTITVVRMQVPCCGGITRMALEARSKAHRNVPIKSVTVDPEGTMLEEVWL